jgi:hypothetical protein
MTKGQTHSSSKLFIGDEPIAMIAAMQSGFRFGP